jgi:hypothetical protein
MKRATVPFCAFCQRCLHCAKAAHFTEDRSGGHRSDHDLDPALTGLHADVGTMAFARPSQTITAVTRFLRSEEPIPRAEHLAPAALVPALIRTITVLMAKVIRVIAQTGSDLTHEPPHARLNSEWFREGQQRRWPKR